MHISVGKLNVFFLKVVIINQHTKILLQNVSLLNTNYIILDLYNPLKDRRNQGTLLINHSNII